MYICVCVCVCVCVCEREKKREIHLSRGKSEYHSFLQWLLSPGTLKSWFHIQSSSSTIYNTLSGLIVRENSQFSSESALWYNLVNVILYTDKIEGKAIWNNFSDYLSLCIFNLMGNSICLLMFKNMAVR